MIQANTSAHHTELAQLSELIDNIYEGTTAPQQWGNILTQIADWVGAPMGLLFTPLHNHENGGFHFNHGIPDHVLQLWNTHWHGKDVYVQIAVERGLITDGNVGIGEDLLPFEKLQQEPIYRELNHPNGIDHFLFSVVFGLSAENDRPTIMSFYRSLNDGNFTESHKYRLQLILPHVSRALGTMVRLRDMEFKAAASLAALDRLNTGIVLFDSGGALCFANRSAQRILAEEDGVRLRHLTENSGLGEIIIEDSKAQENFSNAIKNAISPDPLHTLHFSQAVSISRPSGRQAYTFNFSSLATQNEFGSEDNTPHAIAFVTDSAEPIRLNAELMKKTYGLTSAEIRVAEMLAECLTVEETAEQLGISRSTVKAHQQHIYEKTNTNSRAKLMKLLMSLAHMK